MGKSLTVSLTNEYLKGLARNEPITALSELMWNSLDADATELKVKFYRNELTAVDCIEVVDNGHGIDYDTVEATFGNLGNSNKALGKKTKLGRYFHGHLGWGRYRALALGGSAKWISVYKDALGNYKQFEISCNASEPLTFNISDPEVAAGTSTGVTVIIDAIHDKVSSQISDSDPLFQKVNQIFAPYLMTYQNIDVVFDDKVLKPSIIIEKEDTKVFSATDKNNNTAMAQLKIYWWKVQGYKDVWACSSAGTPYQQEKFNQLRTGDMSFSAYICSDYIDELWKGYSLELGVMDPLYSNLLTEARKILIEYYKEWNKEQATKTVARFKEEGVYPYQGIPKDSLDEVERQTFDICVAKINEVKPEAFGSSKTSDKLTLSLLKETLRSDPDNLRKVLEEVFNLSQNELKDFADVLEKTSLSSIISTTKLVNDRLKFLNGLEQIVYGENSDHVKERSQLHKILLHELWIFGDNYAHGVSDQRLYNVLKEYVEYIGRTELVNELSPDEIKSLNDIPDICLWQQYSLGRPEEVENLVIELKKPSESIKDEHLSQIKRYAQAVASNSRFPKGKTKWTFILIGGKIDKIAAFGLKTYNREPGYYILEQDNELGITVKIKEWGEIISSAKARHKFLEEKLMNSATNEEGINYLRQKYSDLLPQEII